MKTRFLNKHRTLLIARLSEIDLSLAGIKSEFADISKEQTNFLKDGIDHTVEQNNLNTLIDRYERQQFERKQVVAALERITTGSFCECLKCGDEIPERRLLANPTALLCLECQSQKESYAGMALARVHKINFSSVVPFFTTQLEVA